jgi:hypothetical protein
MRENLTLHADGVCGFLRFLPHNASGILIAKEMDSIGLTAWTASVLFAVCLPKQ